MMLLLDQGLPRSAVEALDARGILATHVGDLNMSTATDEEILETARKEQAVVVTLDADFHQLLATSNAAFPSVIRIRIEGLKGEAMANILQRVVEIASVELSAGAVVSVTPSRVRIHLLPIGG